jgi:pyruvate carboxylase
MIIIFNGHDCVTEYVSKENLVEAIKTSKKEHDSSEQKTSVSIPNIMKDNTSEIIEKIDSKIPVYAQLYSDVYKKYLHIMSNFYGTSCLAQKEFFDKMGVNDAILTMFDVYLRLVKQMILLQIDINESMAKSYVGHRLTVLDFYDQMINTNIANFAKMFFPIFDDFKK